MTEPDPQSDDVAGTVQNVTWTPVGAGVVDDAGVVRAPALPPDLVALLRPS